MSAAAEAVQLLAGRGWTLATAESVTGGLVAASLTDVPGASAVLRGGVVSYATDVKQHVLGVPAGVLREHGAVSEECALAMAAGARRLLAADWAVSTTGVAGPETSEGYAVGTVHVAVVGEHDRAHRALQLDGSREEIRRQTVAAVLALLVDVVGRLSVPAGTVEISSSTTTEEG